MKKVIKYASLFLAASAIVMSCKKSDDPTPNDSTSTGDAVCIGGNKTYVLIDASTSSGAANYPRNFSCTVSNTQGYDTIYLDIKAQHDMDYIYITESVDNGYSQKLSFSNTLKTDNGKDVTSSSSDYSYQIAPGVNSITEFKLKIPVPVRTSSSAVSDVYSIWMTNGKGDFTAPTKKTVVGPIKVALKYASGLTYGKIIDSTIGDQNAVPASYIATTGYLGTVKGVTIDSDTAFQSIDVNFVGLTADGTALGTTPYFVSPDIRKSLGFNKNIYDNARKTKYDLYTGGLVFDDFKGNELYNLPAPTMDRVKVAADKLYIFQTANGNKGIIHVTSLGFAGGNTALVSVKVLD
jgi:hypothetical protein